MVPTMKRFEIQILRKAGHSQREIARLSGVSVKTVRRVGTEQTVIEVDDVAARNCARAKPPLGPPAESSTCAST